MESRLCRGSFRDSQGLEHAADVNAASLFEAVALAVNKFARSGLAERPSLGAEMEVIVYPADESATRHKVKVEKVANWARSHSAKGPYDIIRRNRVRELMGIDS